VLNTFSADAPSDDFLRFQTEATSSFDAMKLQEMSTLFILLQTEEEMEGTIKLGDYVL
jgi:hypothetical protein